MKTLTDRRRNPKLRSQFNTAYNDMALILPCYTLQDRFEVMKAYLNRFDLLNASEGAKGRLIDKLSWVF